MHRKLMQLGFGLICALFACGLAHAATDDAAKYGRRTALVIGNGAYKSAPLDNPAKDAKLIAEALKEAHFKVIKLENASREAMLKAITEFGDELDRGGVGLFYYAGHGVQVRGENYLMPVDINVTREEEIRTRAVNAQEVLDRMAGAKNGLNLVFLDACRNDPFPRSTRAAGGGLAKMDAALGMLVSFATSPGSVAEDGKAGNSPYTKHLAAAIKQPGLRVEDVLKRVRSAVRQDTEGRQITWDNSSIEGDFFFTPGNGQVAMVAPTDQGPRAELSFWNSVKDSGNPNELRLYLKRYPNGEFAELAKTRIRALEEPAPTPRAAETKPQRPTAVATARPAVMGSSERLSNARSLFPRVDPKTVSDDDIATARDLKERLAVIDETRERQNRALTRGIGGGGNSVTQYAEKSWGDWRAEMDRAIAAKRLDQAEEEISSREAKLGIGQ